MTITIKSNPGGVSGAIQVNGVDKVTIGASGITAGSFAPNSIDAAAAALAFSGANQSLAPSGYQKLPSGLIIQWGRLGVGDIVTDYYGSVAFPITFPNNLFMINATLYSYNQGAFDATVAVTVQRLTGFDFTLQEWGGVNQNIEVVYIAIGY